MKNSGRSLFSEQVTYVGLALLSSPRCWNPHFADIRMYLESCMALDHGNSNDNLPDAFLTTDDHQFFQFLVQSRMISNLFRNWGHVCR